MQMIIKINVLIKGRQTVIPVTPAADRARYGNFTVSGKHGNEEVDMAALINKTQSRVVRWFKEFSARNRPPYRWYENDHYGV